MALTARLQMKHGVVFIVSNTILYDGISRSECRDILVIGDLEERYTISARGVRHRTVGSNKTLVEEFIFIEILLA